MTSELLTLIFGLIGVFALIASGGYTILLVCQSQIRLCERHSIELVSSLRKETDARLEALRLEFQERIESLRLETKNDRHDYAERIDSVLAEIRDEMHKIDKSVAALGASVVSAFNLKGGS